MASATRYADQLATLLPEGKAWDTPLCSARYNLLRGLTDEWARVEANANKILADAFPQDTETFLDEWERVAGLPDTGRDRTWTNVQSTYGDTVCGDLIAYPEQNILVSCAASRTDSQRRTDLVTKLGVWGGASAAYFEAISTEMGTSIAVEELKGALCGETVCGETCGGWEWNYVWRVRVSAATVIDAVCGTARCGDALYTLVMPHCAYWLQRFKPAHTFILWGLLWYYLVDEGGNSVVDENGNKIIGVI
jgi:uncharacterized protein YmfQ (DUF2313 family)